MEDEEHEEGYAMGENWDGVLRDSEARRNLGGCLGQREATDIVRNGGRRIGGISYRLAYIHRACTCNPGFQVSLKFAALSDC